VLLGKLGHRRRGEFERGCVRDDAVDESMAYASVASMPLPVRVRSIARE
jgi:hypothetical protein